MRNKIISSEILYEIHSTSYEEHIFRVPYDWNMFNDRLLNAKSFFKLYTMNNDSLDILWKIRHQLN